MLRLKTFGALAIMRDGELAEGVRFIRKHLALLVVLAADGAAGVTRDRLIGLFWPDSEPEDARHSLHVAMSAARKTFGADVILEGQASLQLNAALLTSDIGDYHDALAKGDLEAAVAAYTGPFLDAVYLDKVPEWDQWSHNRRTAFANEFVDALLKLADAAIAAGNFPAAVGHTRRAAAADPLSGQVVRALMTALAYSGDETAALNAFRVHSMLVREELEAEPDARVTALADEVRAGRVRPPANIVVVPPRPVASIPAAPVPEPQVSPTAPVDPSPSVAVLVFVPITTDAGDTYFSDGMTDAIINALSRLPGLRVCARTTVYSLRNYVGDVTDVGRRLGVRTVVEGTVIRSGDRVRVSAKLINVHDGTDLWLGEYLRDLTDVFAIQDEIAQAIAQTLKVALLEHRMPPRRAVVTAAYEKYLHGRHFRDKRSPESLRRAIAYYREAIKLEPGYALAYAAEADTYAAALAYGVVSPADATPRIRESATRAIELDPAMAEPHAALGAVAAMCDRDWNAAEKHFQRALALNPQYQTAYMWYANYCLAPLGRLEEGLAALKKARRLDLLSPVINCSIGMTLYFMRRYDEAVEQFHTALELDSGFLYANYFLGRTEVQRGRFASAIEALERTVALSSGAAVARCALGYAHARSGDEEEARGILKGLEAPAAGEYVSAFEPAYVHLGLGEEDAAIAGFERAAAEHTPFAIWLGVLPELDHLRGKPRFDAILRGLGLPA